VTSRTSARFRLAFGRLPGRVQRRAHEIIWFWIGSHTDYDRLLRELAG